MKLLTLAAILASASAAYAHATVKAVFINGVDKGNGEKVYIRSPPNNNPVKDLSSKNVACNVNNVPVLTTLEVSAGDVITFEWSHDRRGDDILAGSHKGSALVYVAPTSSNGEGAVWNKIFQETYVTEWATDKLIKNGGHVSITVPDLEAGEYLFRPELITLHESDTAYNANPARGVQLYMECVQFKIVSNGSTKIPTGIDFTTSYTYSDKGLVYDLYNGDPKTYVAPGGELSSIAVAGQAGIGPIPAGGSKPAAPNTTESASVPTGPVYGNPAATPTSFAASTTESESVPTGPAYGNPATKATSSAASTTQSESVPTEPVYGNPAATPTSSAASTTESESVPTGPAYENLPAPSTTDYVSTSSRAPLPTNKMTRVTLRSSAATPAYPPAVATPTSCDPNVPYGGKSGDVVTKYYQCGGTGYTGSTTCAEGTKCVVQNPYYSQCL